MKINLPLRTQSTTEEIEVEQLVVIGANGSGKTRFGSRIEQLNSTNSHRISAQKSLKFPSEVSPKSRERAEKEFYYGIFQNKWVEKQYLGQKNSYRWGNNSNTHLLNDFDKLLVLLHTEEYECSLDYKEGRTENIKTKLDTVKTIWEQILTHRKLYKKAGVIEVHPTEEETNKYNATEMSDGERVIFYLIGSCVCVPENSILIIDEPEMHIHRSLVKKLFDLIENQRQDCLFVYLTHDIDFAFSRHKATKIWAKSYEDSNLWDYEILYNQAPIPEQLYLDILGSRKSVIFLEGDESSIDYQLYEQVYTDYTLKPLGSCHKVIESVKSFNEQNSFHHIKSFGIIDKDRRKIDYFKKLNAKNIWVLDVAEVENLLLIKGIVEAIAHHMGKNESDVFNEVKNNIIMFFFDQMKNQILLHFKEELRRKLIEVSNFDKKNISDVLPEIEASLNSINKQQIYNDIENEFKTIYNTSDYDEILRVFNLKNALIPHSKVCQLTGLKNKEEYLNLVITLLKRKDEVSSTISDSIKNKIIKDAHQ